MKCCKLKVLGVVVLVIAAFVGGTFAVPYVPQLMYKFARKQMSQTAALNELVRETKAQMQLPHKNDDNTVLVDLRADPEDMSVVYQMEVHGLGVEDEKQLKKSLHDDVMKLCDKDEAKAALRQGVKFKWVHHFVDVDKAYITTLDSVDCKL